jgi:hypothetical protein
MPKTNYRGDTGLFRAALDAAGFKSASDTYDSRHIFNDNSKDHLRRRLKLWFADAVFEAPQKQQRKLERELRARFGDRILAMYFTQSPTWYRYGGHSLCIRLQD